MHARLTHHWKNAKVRGVSAALLSACVLGFTAIFGKQAILAGVPAMSVVMLRTVFAAGLLWLGYALFWRKYFFIYPFGLAVCLTAGLVNGLGSIMYYVGLHHLDASLAQLLYTINPIFLTFFYRLDGHPISRFTFMRLGLALVAIYLLIGVSITQSNWWGGFLLIASGVMYALHLFINQHVLYEMPAQTVTVYTLTAMAITVSTAYCLSGFPPLPHSLAGWQPVILLTVFTAISRLALFMGIKNLGSLQTALLGLGETFVAIVAARLLLGENLEPVQWVGAVLLAASILLVAREKSLGILPRPKPWVQLLEVWFLTSFPAFSLAQPPAPPARPAAPPQKTPPPPAPDLPPPEV